MLVALTKRDREYLCSALTREIAGCDNIIGTSLDVSIKEAAVCTRVHAKELRATLLAEIGGKADG